MLEIFLIIYLSKKIGAIALNKGESKNKWVALMVILWIVGEFSGIMIGLLLFGENLLPAALMGYGLAFIMYFILRAILNKKPDVETMEQMIDYIGSEQ